LIVKPGSGHPLVKPVVDIGIDPGTIAGLDANCFAHRMQYPTDIILCPAADVNLQAGVSACAQDVYERAQELSSLELVNLIQPIDNDKGVPGTCEHVREEILGNGCFGHDISLAGVRQHGL